MSAWERDLLDTWEGAASEPPVRRALALLRIVASGCTEDELGSLTASQRDALLLEFRRDFLGDEVGCCADCPACGELVEFSVAVSDLLAVCSVEQKGLPPLRLGDVEVWSRLPTCRDLAECVDLPPEQRERALLRACIERVERRGQSVPVARLSLRVRRGVASWLEQSDAASLTDVRFSCPRCGVGTTVPFDVTSFLFSELADWARQLLFDVHDLARAYGWTEAEILALPPRRRERYLEFVQA